MFALTQVLAHLYEKECECLNDHISLTMEYRRDEGDLALEVTREYKKLYCGCNE